MEGNNVGNLILYVLDQPRMSAKHINNVNKLTFQLLRCSVTGDMSLSLVRALLAGEGAVFLAVCFVTRILTCCSSGG